MRPVTASAWRTDTSCSTNTANTIHSTGPMPAKISDVAFVPPIVKTMSAKIAGSRQPPRRRLRAASAISHGRPAHGSRIAEIRAVYASG